MKKTVLLLFLSIILLVSCNDQEPDLTLPESTVPDFFTYSDEEGIISLIYPNTWTLNPTPANNSVELISPSEETNDFFENLIITHSSLPAITPSFEAYIQNVYNELLDKISEFSLISRESLTVSGQNAVALTFEGKPSYTQDDESEFPKYKWLQVYAQMNNSVFVFSYTSLQDSPSSLLTEAKNIILSAVFFPSLDNKN